MVSIRHILNRLRQERDGNILPLAAMGMILAVIIVGSGIDMARAYKVESRLQSACDAGVLAGRRAVGADGWTGTTNNEALAFFATNFDSNEQGAALTATPVFASPDNGQTVTGSATVTLNTLVMKLFGYDRFDLAVDCASSMGVGNADVIMVLDTTGSMTNSLSGSTRIAALRRAMKNFYTTLDTATSGSNARVRFGFVPYSSSVNVGRLIYGLNPAYLTDQRTYQSREPVYTDEYTTEYRNESQTGWYYYDGQGYYYSSYCQNAIPGNGGQWQNDGSPTNDGTHTTQRQVRRDYDCYRNGYYYVIVRYTYRDRVTSNNTVRVFQRWRYKPISYDVSTYKTFTAVDTLTGENSSGEPRNVRSTWAGCIEERATTGAATFSFSSTAGMTPASAWDVRLDDAPDLSNNATKWSPMWPEVAYRRWNSSNYYTTQETDRGGSAQSFCPAPAQTLAEMSQDDFDDYADALTAEGSTYLDIGMIWGGRMLSPTGMFAANVNEAPDNGGEVSRHIVFMTDGQMEPNYLIQQAWGMEYWDRRVTDNGTNDDGPRHTSRFLAVCEAIKHKGIRIWAVAFTSGLSADLVSCASDSSSFTANSADELNEAFQEIAKEVGELRIIR